MTQSVVGLVINLHQQENLILTILSVTHKIETYNFNDDFQAKYFRFYNCRITTADEESKSLMKKINIIFNSSQIAIEQHI